VSLQAGDLVAEYRVEHLLGSGALGQTWCARHRVLEGRSAVVKVLDPGMSSERLRAYALLHERLRHPGIVGILEVSLTHQPAYVVLEHVAGPSLRQRLLTGALPLSEASRILLQATKALECAHHLEITHGALTLENVLVSDSGEVKLADFRPAAATPFSPAADIRALAALLTRLLTAPSGADGQPADNSPDLPGSLKLVLDRAESRTAGFSTLAGFRRAVSGALAGSSLSGNRPREGEKGSKRASPPPRRSSHGGRSRLDEAGDADTLAEERPGHWVTQEVGLGHARDHPRSHRLKRSQRLATELRLLGCTALVLVPPVLVLVSQVPPNPTVKSAATLPWFETSGDRASDLPAAAQGLVARARRAWQVDDRRESLELLAQALAVAPDDASLQDWLAEAALAEAQRLFHQGKAAHWYQDDEEAAFRAGLEALDKTRPCSSLSPTLQRELSSWRQILAREL
jgi:serine/threonine protein kinase